MKKILGILGTITLIGTSTTSLVACNTPQYSEKELKIWKQNNKINTDNQEIKDNLEPIAPQEKPFNTVDNKWYFVVWKGKTQWYITKFLNNEKINQHGRKVLKEEDGYELGLYRYSLNYEVDLFDYEQSKMTNWPWRIDKGTYFKSVYRWNNEEQNLTNLIIDNDGNIKVN
ncbi:lipoprotein [Spiroplasma endosymbiont of Megaselia nigra]|uniref:lipoprotein n=1 Tax=Spiroplasma endosymbiont of Megaselia nigra TaxID=2478537 RepID=UPI000F870ABE|nr:lipoprotein [Spiroplasma endosymbiont of Megaselia nigra]RUO85831.1 hypothetical protein D9R21_06510 [Spiroplasma endosymbiont of Megaselia nigra]